MKVRALIRFNDYKENITRNIGDVFEVSEARYKEILEKGGLWVEPIEEPKVAQNLKNLTRVELEEIAESLDITDKEIKAARNKDKLIELINGRA